MKWEESTISEVCQIISGYAFNSKKFNKLNQGLPIIRIRDINKKSTDAFYDGDYSEKYLVSKGDFLIGMDGEFNMSKWKGEKAILNQRTCKIIPNSKVVNPQYIYYYLPKKLKEIEDKTSFATVKHISVKQINNIQISLPPLPIQQKIADALDKADAIRQYNKNILEKYEKLAQSVFLEMFGDPIVNQCKWKVKQLKEVTNLITDGKHGDCKSASNSGYFFLSAKNIRNGLIDYRDARQIDENDFLEVHKRTNLKENDILLVNTGATIGKVAIVKNDPRNKNTTFQKSVAVIKPNLKLLSSVFAKYLFQIRIKGFMHSSSGSAVKNLLLIELRRFEIILPPIFLQSRFERHIKIIEEMILKNKSISEKSEELFQSLLQRAFKGELFN